MSTGEEEVVGILEVRGGKIRIPNVRAVVREAHHHRELSFFVPPGSVIRVKDPVKLIIAGPVPRVISAKVVAHMPSARGDIGDHYDAKIADEQQYPDGLDKPPAAITPELRAAERPVARGGRTMPSDDVEIVTGRLQRSDADVASNVEARVRDKQWISFPFRKGTIVVGEQLTLRSDDRAVEFVVNSELPPELGEDDAIYDGRILKDVTIEPSA